MKKHIFISLTALFLGTALTLGGCAQGGSVSEQPSTAESTVSVAVSQESSTSNDQSSETSDSDDLDVQQLFEETLHKHNFEGAAYAEKNGEVLASFAQGTLENGDPITIDTPMPIGSVSKQFCAAAILLLQEQGKLSVDDTLDKYYPEYTYSNQITLKNLLSMRSGIPNYGENIYELVSIDKTEEENTDSLKNWIFSQPLDFEPDSKYTYSNGNFFLLGNIVEQVSGKKYIDFLRENFFAPLGMTHTGSIDELSDSPDWAEGISYQEVDSQPGLTKGAGDLISNAADMTLWLNALSSGKAISAESYQEMTEDYSPEEGYGYGLRVRFGGGVGHPGGIGSYSAVDYIDTDEGITLFFTSNTVGESGIPFLFFELVRDLQQ